MYIPKASFLFFFLLAPSNSFAPGALITTSSPRSSALWTQSSSNEDWTRQAQAAERKVQRLNRLLTTLERRSTQERLEWTKERTALTHKVNVLKELLREATPAAPTSTNTEETVEALELEVEMAHEHESELVQEQERLEREVLILQDQIVQIRNLLKTEQYRSQELEEQFDQWEEAHEAEVMQYQVQVEAQAREIQAMRDKLAFYEQHPPPPEPIYASNGGQRNETVALS